MPPTCGRCGSAHYNFVACAEAKAKTEREIAARPTNLVPLSAVLTDTPDGLKQASGWGKTDGWGQGIHGPGKAA